MYQTQGVPSAACSCAGAAFAGSGLAGGGVAAGVAAATCAGAAAGAAAAGAAVGASAACTSVSVTDHGRRLGNERRGDLITFAQVADADAASLLDDLHTAVVELLLGEAPDAFGTPHGHRKVGRADDRPFLDFGHRHRPDRRLGRDGRRALHSRLQLFYRQLLAVDREAEVIRYHVLVRAFLVADDEVVAIDGNDLEFVHGSRGRRLRLNQPGKRKSDDCCQQDRKPPRLNRSHATFLLELMRLQASPARLGQGFTGDSATPVNPHVHRIVEASPSSEMLLAADRSRLHSFRPPGAVRVGGLAVSPGRAQWHARRGAMRAACPTS